MRFFINICSKDFYASSLQAVGFLGFLCAAYSSNAEELSSALGLKMKYLSQNQSVISKNLANANTPKYKALELKEPKYKVGNSPSLKLATTSPMHIDGLGSPGSNFKAVKQKDAYETAPNGNNVSVEEQMVKMSANNVEHQTTASLMKKVNNLMALSAGGQ